MATITLSHGLPSFDWLQLLSLAFDQGTLSGGGSTIKLTAGTTVVTFSGSGLAGSGHTLTAGSITSITLSSGGTTVAVANGYGSPISSASVQQVLDLFHAPGTPGQQDVLDAFGLLFFSEPVSINGSNDAETIYGSLLYDTIVHAGDGHDTVIGGAGNDDLYGDAGFDLLRGEDGGDFLFGGDGHDELYGGAGSDVLIGGGGYDRMFGGDGWDVADFTMDVPWAITVDLATGVAYNQFGELDVLYGIEEVRGGWANDKITGDGHQNWLYRPDQRDGGAAQHDRSGRLGHRLHAAQCRPGRCRCRLRRT